jgi:hypothetical protein
MQLTVPGLSTASMRLGYGCSQLMGGITQRESIALLQTAFDAGIRHFDTAPSYGYGQAESVLGQALGSRRGEVTIATKFGIRPPRNGGLLSVARRLLLPVAKRVPAIRFRLARAAGSLKGRDRFSPGELRASIDASLKALATDYIDILLLHEATVTDLSDELFEELGRARRAGKIRSFGVGSEEVAAAKIYGSDRRFCPVMQFEWSVLRAEKPVFPGSFLITHRSLSGNLIALRNWLCAHPQVALTWSKELGLDIASAPVLSRLMLVAARNANPDGLTLFSSRNPENIRANARLMLDACASAQGTAFALLVAREASAITQVGAN